MPVLREIVRWAQTVPGWQREAVTRLLQEQALTPEDEEELYAMLKAAHGLTVGAESKPAEAKAVPERCGDDVAVKHRVVLRKMHSVRNVNALAEGQSVEFAESGVTVIYGENAAGKSGYSRVLKKACHARQKKSEILPNVFEARAGGAPEATFDLDIDGVLVQEKWVDNAPSAEALSQIAVFDSECARVFVDEANEVVYIPYGLDVFRKLAAVCIAFGERLENEITSLPVAPHVLNEFAQNTAVGKVVGALRHDTPRESVEVLAGLSDVESRRLTELRKLVADSKVNDPKVKAETLRRQRRRFERLVTAVGRMRNTLSGERIQRLQSLRSDAEAAKDAAQLACSEAFEREPLAGVGGDPWKQMFEAARRYSESIAYPGQPFPVIEGDARCVLCQQRLDEEAGQRLERFADFVRQDTAKVSAEKSAAFARDVIAFADTDFQPERQDPEVLGEVRQIESSTGDQLARYLDSARSRAGAIRKACEDGEWERIPALGEPPAIRIKSIIDRLEADAKALDEVAGPEEQTKVEVELRELEDRARVAAHKDEILTHLKRLQDEYCLRVSKAETDTAPITRKETRLSEKAITGKLRDALTKELAQLGLSHVPVTFRKTGRYGQTRHQLELFGSRLGMADLSDVLCEGEQSVVAIASFLAELQTSSENCGIVLDDPVCSLDHLYRQRVAERLVCEGQKRQVVIFTHDIVFLLAISSAAAEQRVPLLTQTIRRHRDKPGICESSLPWHAMNVKERLKYVRAVLDEARRAQKGNDAIAYEALAGRAYGLLRETWERAIEEVLLNDSINRFRPSIETMRLKAVSLEDSDYVVIDKSMSKCSTWMAGHDSSGAIASPMPDPSGIEADIKELEAFIRTIHARHETVRRARDAALQPPAAVRPR